MCSSAASISNINLVQQILEQGQNLRKAMVRSILNGDPFNAQIYSGKHVRRLIEDEPPKASDLCKNPPAKTPLSDEDKRKFVAYLRGDHMSKPAERRALQVFEEMSNTEIYELTERSYPSSDNNCDCDTCKNYYKHSLSCDFNHSSTELCKEVREIPPLKLRDADANCGPDYLKSGLENLRHVNSLRVFVHSLTLNQEGNRKVYGGALDKKIKLPLSVNHTYFIEYRVPELLLKKLAKSKSKVDSGLTSGNIVRLCSKRLCGEAVYFKQISLHDVCVSDEMDVFNASIKFQVSCRTLKQKSINVIGHATFNFARLLHSKYYMCDENLSLILSCDVPIVLGSLKVMLQLGCGQLYFGKELIDALNANKENLVIETPTQNNEENHKNIQKDTEKKHISSVSNLNSARNELDLRGATYDFALLGGGKRQFPDVKTGKTRISDEVRTEKNTAEKTVEFPEKEKKDVLFSFICIIGARFFKETGNTYVTCQPFSQKDVLYSRLINCSSDPIYNFHTIIPVVYDDELLNELRDNYMVFEFWEKLDRQDVLLGICKVPLHQLYVTYRNPIIVKYLTRNNLPVIACDWWEPVCDPLSGEVHGQSQLLVALGSHLQIHNLETERGFKDESVTAVFFSRDEAAKSKRNEKSTNRGGAQCKKNARNTETAHKKFKSEEGEGKRSKDIGVQANLKMDKPEQQGRSAQTDLLTTALLAQLAQQKQDAVTNTEVNLPPQDDVQVNTNVRKTADLLDSLQSVLSVDLNRDNSFAKDTFKAHVIIESALHLPSRKKCKSKKSRGRNSKQEEILPSTYVTFETLPGRKLEITEIVPQSKNPEWDYGCDVALPTDLLTDNQKCLIFKVWRKSNSSSVQPNLQADAILGFAAVDLTVLTAGLPTVSGWFNITDFSSKCNGQIKISVSPMENLSRFRAYKKTDRDRDNSGASFRCAPPPQQKPEADEPGELLSRALKRKFNELDEITQRLRLRLSHVTNDESDASNDDFAEEFEKDINTLCIEDDYDMINFEDVAKETITQGASSALLQIQSDFIREGSSSSAACTMDQIDSNLSDSTSTSQIDERVNTVNPLDKQLIEGRQKIDTLLEKLSLLTTHNDVDAFGGRYISGCSVENDNNKFVEVQVDSSSAIDPLGSSSSSSGLSQPPFERRPVPDGSGNTF